MTTSIVSCEALVLRNLRFGETSRVVTFCTAELGKVAAMAKGARDPRGPFGASLELMTHAHLVLYFRPGRTLQFLKTASVEREYRGILRNPRRFLWGSAWVEFLDRVLSEEEPSDALFELALRGLRVCEEAAENRLPEFFRGLQLRAASLLGYAPRLDQCRSCGRKVQDSALVRPAETERRSSRSSRSEAADLDPEPLDTRVWFFHPSEGDVVCPACARSEPAEGQGIPLSPRALRRLRAMAMGGNELRRVEPTDGGRGGKSERANGDAVHARKEQDPSAQDSTLGSRETGSVGPPSPLWMARLDRLTEEFLRHHIETYRGLRSLEIHLNPGDF